MPTVYYGSKNEPGFELSQSDDLIAVRSRSGRSIARSGMPVANEFAAELTDAEIVATFPEASVEIYRIPKGAKSTEARKSALKAAPDVRFAGGVLVDPATSSPVLYTENLFVKFRDDADPDTCEAALREAGLTIKSKLTYATNAYFASAPEGSGQTVFETAEKLLGREDVEYSHPELIRPRARKGVFPQQWHLRATAVGGGPVNAHVNAEEAHAVTRGAGVTIAIIDDGVDVDHAEFLSPGKITAPRDATLGIDDPRPKDPVFGGRIRLENHGTACAGVACASGVLGASGVAPEARLMPIRLSSGLGSQKEADAFVWAADHGADVISCSWGPSDGAWFNPADPVHQEVVQLPPSARLAIDYATNTGRGGKGCVVLFAAGNGNEPAGNDGYASYQRVVAVAACNDRGRRSVYSDFGKAVWCAFPSSDFGHAPFNHPEPLTPGIWTTDRTGAKGYNPGDLSTGDAAGHFANDFGGTSSACPGAAGVAALVLAVNPDLRWQDVRDVLKRACDRIDPQNGNYDAAGHSDLYGFGRLNALTAVKLAAPAPQNAVTVSQRFDAAIPDLQTAVFSLEVAASAPAQSVTVAVDIKHTYIGDLVLTLVPPSASGVDSIILHNRAGGSAKNLVRTFDAAGAPALDRLTGRSCKGNWKLKIEDRAAEDFGILVSFGLTITFAHESVAIRSIRPLVVKRTAKSPRKRATVLASAS